MNKAILTHAKMEMKLFFRDWMQLFFTFVLPAGLFIMFGEIYGSMPFQGKSYFDTYIPAMISIIILNTSLFTLGVQLVVDREKGVLRRLKGTPMRPWVMFIGILLKGFIGVLIGAVEIIALGYFIFHALPSPHLLLFFVFLIFTYVAFSSIGILVSSVSRKVGIALCISFILMYIMMFLSGTTVPLAEYPEVLVRISDWVPLTHVHRLLIDAWEGVPGTQHGVSFLVLLGICAVCTGIGSKFFAWE
ncbi:ABC transporter permease [Paenibacillus dendritiformis]|uniref:ABC transporter permease n=1 Tax=Paenibacillus dendritiformis TaxID=130049 RepID=UPI00364F6928